MRVTHTPWIFTLLLGLLLGSCSSSSGVVPASSPSSNTMTGTPSDLANAVAVSSLQGNWATDCLPDESLYTKRAIAVTNENVEFAFAFFSDTTCTQAASVGILDNGHSVATQAVTVPTGALVSTTLGDASAIDFYFGDVTLDGRPAPSSVAALFAPEVFYDIVLVDGERLYLGDATLAGYGGNTPETRPISLDFNNIYIRTP